MDASADNMQTEVEFYRQNQTVVEDEIRALIADNHKLSQQVGILLKEKLDHARQSHAHSDERTKDIEELTKQVSVIAKERDSLHVLWQTSQKTIDALETELKTYTDYDDSRGIQNIHEEKRDLDLKLQTALADYIELESKYKELFGKHTALEHELKSRERDIAAYKERGKDMEEKIQELEKEIDGYRIDLAAERKTSGVMNSQLSLLQKDAIDRAKKETEAKSKVAEALQLYDLVCAQKNNAVRAIKDLRGELAHLKHNLTNVRQAVETVCRKEVEELKEKYNEKLTDMLEHIRNLDTELSEKRLLLNKAMRENKILQTVNKKYIKQHNENRETIDPKLAIAEQRMDTMFQELVVSERRNIQLVCEKQCLAIDIQKIQDFHARETKRRDWEESLLKNQCEELRIQVEHLQKSLDETHEMVNKVQNLLSSRTELNQKMVSSKEEELKELNKHLQNQMELSKKWKESYLEMSEKLKKKLQDLHKDNNELRSQLKLPNLSSNYESTSS